MLRAAAVSELEEPGGFDGREKIMVLQQIVSMICLKFRLMIMHLFADLR